jgi:hypothetical protein
MALSEHRLLLNHLCSKTWIPMFGSSNEPARSIRKRKKDPAKSDRVESTKVALEYYDPSIRSIRLVYVPVRADIF